MNKLARLLLAVLATSPMCLSGCAAFAYIMTQLAPPQKKPAIYKPPRGKTVLVFVDDVANRVSYEPIKSELTEFLNKHLEENKVAAKTIPYESLQRLIFATPKFNRLAVSQVGSRLGADIVIYVEINKFSLKDNPISPIWRGRFATTVRVVDVDPKKGRLWPKDREKGFPVSLKIPPRTNSSPAYASKLASIMARKMADAIAKLFYDHEVPAEDPWSWDDEEQQKND